MQFLDIFSTCTVVRHPPVHLGAMEFHQQHRGWHPQAPCHHRVPRHPPPEQPHALASAVQAPGRVRHRLAHAASRDGMLWGTDSAHVPCTAAAILGLEENRAFCDTLSSSSLDRTVSSRLVAYMGSQSGVRRPDAASPSLSVDPAVPEPDVEWRRIRQQLRSNTWDDWVDLHVWQTC
jgi:hypothetical protein